MEAKILSGAEIDFQKLSKLLKESFAESSDSELQVNEKMLAMSEVFLRNKYTNGIKAAKLAVVTVDDLYVACNGLLFVPIQSTGIQVDGWMSCDTATHPEYRGKGLFKKCIEALQKELPHETIFFGYPNVNSINTFVKIGWTIKIPFDVRITLCAPSLPIRSVEMVSSFSNLEVLSLSPCGVRKNHEYLNWRYHDSRSKYLRYVSKDQSFAFVARRIRIRRFSIFVLLDVFALNDDSFRLALRAVRRVAWANQCLFILFSSQGLNSRKVFPRSSLSVPDGAIGRKITLMGRAFGEKGNGIWKDKWSTSLGDWDVF